MGFKRSIGKRRQLLTHDDETKTAGNRRRMASKEVLIELITTVYHEG